MNTIQAFMEGAEDIVAAFNEWARERNVGFRVDHICYKCETKDEFDRMRAMFDWNSKYIHSSIISDRIICYVKLKKPITTVMGEIWFVELSAQKPDNSQVSGFDHIEIYASGLTAEQLAGRFMARTGVSEFKEVKRPHHTTYDATIPGTRFKVRLEDTSLIWKIKNEEM